MPYPTIKLICCFIVNQCFSNTCLTGFVVLTIWSQIIMCLKFLIFRGKTVHYFIYFSWNIQKLWQVCFPPCLKLELFLAAQEVVGLLTGKNFLHNTLIKLMNVMLIMKISEVITGSLFCLLNKTKANLALALPQHPSLIEYGS